MRSYARINNNDFENEHEVPVVSRQCHASWKANLNLPSDVTSTAYAIPISEISDIECFRFEVVGATSTVFYVPGSASATFYPYATEMVCTFMAMALNCNVIAIFHRKGSSNKFPVPCDDVTKTIQVHLKQRESYNIQNNICLAGYSSGGLIALQTCLRWEGSLPINRLLLLGPVTNLADNPKRKYEKGLHDLSPNYYSTLAPNFVPHGRTSSDPMLSPVNLSEDLLQLLPSTLILVGENDFLRPDITSFYEKLSQVKPDTQFLNIENAGHMFLWHRPDVFEHIQCYFESTDKSFFGSSTITLPEECQYKIETVLKSTVLFDIVAGRTEYNLASTDLHLPVIQSVSELDDFFPPDSKNVKHFHESIFIYKHILLSQIIVDAFNEVEPFLTEEHAHLSTIARRVKEFLTEEDSLRSSLIVKYPACVEIVKKSRYLRELRQELFKEQKYSKQHKATFYLDYLTELTLLFNQWLTIAIDLIKPSVLKAHLHGWIQGLLRWHDTFSFFVANHQQKYFKNQLFNFNIQQMNEYNKYKELKQYSYLPIREHTVVKSINTIQPFIAYQPTNYIPYFMCPKKKNQTPLEGVKLLLKVPHCKEKLTIMLNTIEIVSGWKCIWDYTLELSEKAKILVNLKLIRKENEVALLKNYEIAFVKMGDDNLIDWLWNYWNEGVIKNELQYQEIIPGYQQHEIPEEQQKILINKLKPILLKAQKKYSRKCIKALYQKEKIKNRMNKIIENLQMSYSLYNWAKGLHSLLYAHDLPIEPPIIENVINQFIEQPDIQNLKTSVIDIYMQWMDYVLNPLELKIVSDLVHDKSTISELGFMPRLSTELTSTVLNLLKSSLINLSYITRKIVLVDISTTKDSLQCLSLTFKAELKFVDELINVLKRNNLDALENFEPANQLHQFHNRLACNRIHYLEQSVWNAETSEHCYIANPCPIKNIVNDFCNNFQIIYNSDPALKKLVQPIFINRVWGALYLEFIHLNEGNTINLYVDLPFANIDAYQVDIDLFLLERRISDILKECFSYVFLHKHSQQALALTESGFVIISNAIDFFRKNFKYYNEELLTPYFQPQNGKSDSGLRKFKIDQLKLYQKLLINEADEMVQKLASTEVDLVTRLNTAELRNHLQQLLEAYYTLDYEMLEQLLHEPSYESIGLDLPIVRRLCEKIYGGFCIIESLEAINLQQWCQCYTQFQHYSHIQILHQNTTGVSNLFIKPGGRFVQYQLITVRRPQTLQATAEFITRPNQQPIRVAELVRQFRVALIELQQKIGEIMTRSVIQPTSPIITAGLFHQEATDRLDADISVVANKECSRLNQ